MSNRKVNLIDGRYVKWAAISANANSKAVKPWCGRIRDSHPDGEIEYEWLQTTTIDGNAHFNIERLSEGTLIKVSGATHQESRHRYYKITDIGDATIELEQVKKREVLEGPNS